MNESEDGSFATLVIVAAGRGERFGNADKVLEMAGGKPLLAWSLLAAEQAVTISDVVIVIGDRIEDHVKALVTACCLSKPVTLVSGGSRRQHSVAAGVFAAPESSEVVLVHDGARPMVPARLFDECARQARIYGAAIVAAPVSDTLKQVTGLEIERTVSRDGLWGAQTPQGFRRSVIVSAIERTRESDVEFTDKASILEALGEPVRIVPGERTNIKVTHREDLEIVDALLFTRTKRTKGGEAS